MSEIREKYIVEIERSSETGEVLSEAWRSPDTLELHRIGAPALTNYWGNSRGKITEQYYENGKRCNGPGGEPQSRAWLFGYLTTEEWVPGIDRDPSHPYYISYHRSGRRHDEKYSNHPDGLRELEYDDQTGNIVCEEWKDAKTGVLTTICRDPITSEIIERETYPKHKPVIDSDPDFSP